MEDVSIDQIVDNVRTILSEVENRMEQGANNIRNMFVKTTMGPAIKIEYDYYERKFPQEKKNL